MHSVVGKIKFTNKEVSQSYFKEGKQRNDRMREGIISDGTRTLKITIWSDLLDIVKENQLLQLLNASSRIFNEEVVVTTNFSTGICYLTEALDVTFDDSIIPQEENPNTNTTTICCPIVESIKINSFLSCKTCHKKVIHLSGTGLCHCTS